MDLVTLQKNSDSSEVQVLIGLERFIKANARLKQAKLELMLAEREFHSALDLYDANALEFIEVRKAFLSLRGQAGTK